MDHRARLHDSVRCAFWMVQMKGIEDFWGIKDFWCIEDFW